MIPARTIVQSIVVLLACACSAVALAKPPQAAAPAQTGLVVGVLDGDTADVLLAGNEQIRCRLAGIDAPEKSQAFGQASKQSLSDMTYRRRVQVQVTDIDRNCYKSGCPAKPRSICWLVVDGLNVNVVQVERGMAMMYRRYSDDLRLDIAENNAKKKRLGIWQQPNPEPPWVYRRK